MTILNLRFSKLDQFNNSVFISNKKNEDELETYEKLVDMSNNLDKLGLDTFMPIYHNVEKEYCSIRFRQSNHKFTERNVYKIDFSMKHKGEYINIYINESVIFKKAEPLDLGVEIDLS